MRWLPVITLPDGSTIEIPMPSPEDTDRHGIHGYRVRGAEGVTGFSTLSELADHVLAAWTPHQEEPTGDAGISVTSEYEGHLHFIDNVHD